MYGHPRGATVPKAPEGKAKMPPVVTVIVIVLVIILVLGALFFSALFSSVDDATPQRRFDDQVLIDNGGHFWWTLLPSWSGREQVTINITSLQGDAFDVYVMDTAQYENAYGNETTGAFSAQRRYENVTRVDDRFELDSDELDILIVIDNRDFQLTPDDAVPSGVIEVDVHLRSVWIDGMM
jgi:hypothetical protein